jgi:hypothetical protein
MSRRIRVALAVAFVMAVTAVAASAMAFTGHRASATPVKVRSPAASAADQIRAERRESFRRTGCSKHIRQNAPDV